MTLAKYFTYHENFLWNSFRNVTHITNSKSQRVEPNANLTVIANLAAHPKSPSCWAENLLAKVLSSKNYTLQKTDLSDVYCIIILRRSSELEVEKKWRLTRRDL